MEKEGNHRNEKESFTNALPCICVPVVEETVQGSLQKIEEAVWKEVPMIEIRADHMADLADCEKLLLALSEQGELIRGTMVLATFRSKAQGGQKEITTAEYEHWLDLATASPVVNLVDIEFFENRISQVSAQIASVHAKGKQAVASYHDFFKTPSTEEMKQIFLAMNGAGADFCKLALMPEKKSDVLRLMEAALLAKEEVPAIHLIAIAMGEEGKISRVIGEYFGSEVTFASLGKTSAPGQLDYETVRGALNGFRQFCVG